MNEKETITTTFQMPVLDKHWWKTFALMLISVIMMGLGVSLLVLTEMGTDPCSAMNYGIARTLGLSFGNYQLLFNTVLLILVILLDWRLIGTERSEIWLWWATRLISSAGSGQTYAMCLHIFHLQPALAFWSRRFCFCGCCSLLYAQRARHGTL